LNNGVKSSRCNAGFFCEFFYRHSLIIKYILKIFSVGHIKRTAGHTAIAAAAYRAGEKIYDAYYGETQDYSRKKGVVATKIYAPDYVPERLRDRQTLWTEVEFNEHRKDAQLAYSLDIALQNEMTMEENIELLDRFVTEEMVPIGMIVDVAIHNPD